MLLAPSQPLSAPHSQRPVQWRSAAAELAACRTADFFFSRETASHCLTSFRGRKKKTELQLRRASPPPPRPRPETTQPLLCNANWPLFLRCPFAVPPLSSSLPLFLSSSRPPSTMFRPRLRAPAALGGSIGSRPAAQSALAPLSQSAMPASARRNGRRSIHHMPISRHDPRVGVPNLLSAEGYDLAWTQHMMLMLNRLNQLVTGESVFCVAMSLSKLPCFFFPPLTFFFFLPPPHRHRLRGPRPQEHCH